MNDLVLRDYRGVEDLRQRMAEMEKHPTTVIPDTAKYETGGTDDWDSSSQEIDQVNG